MSDKRMTESLNPDDHAILLALAQVTAGGIEVPLPATADRARVREYVELLGLLPYGLEPATPSAEVKARILAAVGGRPNAAATPAEARPAEATPAEAAPQRNFDEVTFAGAIDSDPLDMTFRRVAPVSVATAGTEPGWQELPAAATPTAADPEPELPELESADADAVIAKFDWSEPPQPAAPEPVATAPEPAWQEPEPPQPAAPEPVAEPAWQEPEPLPLAAREPAPMESASAESEPQEPLPSNVVPIATATRPARGFGSWWTPALAAMLALCMVGLAYLAGKVNEQNATITRLNSELQGLPIEDLSSFYDEFSHMKRRFHMVTAVARHAYPMKTVQPLAPGAQTDGVVYVCGNHQRWYLNLQGLEPAPSGEEYSLWFVTDKGMIHGGVIEVGADASSEMEAQTLPQGTRGFAVTREQAGAPHEEPAGTMVLLAEDSIPL